MPTWSGAGSIGPMPFSVLTDPTAVSKNTGDLDVFVVLEDENLYINSWNLISRRWLGWGSIGSAGGGWISSPTVSVTLIATRLIMTVYVIARDSHLYQKSYEDGRWGEWAQAGPQTLSGNPGNSGIIIAATDNRANLMYAQLTPGAVANLQWNALQDGFVLASAPAFAAGLIFAVNARNHQVYCESLAGSDPPVPNSWRSIGGNIESNLGVVIAQPDAGGQMFVFARNFDGTLWYTHSDVATQNWTAWAQIGDSVGSGITATNKQGNQIDLFYKGPDGTIWNKYGFA